MTGTATQEPAVQDAADRLLDAARNRVPCSPVRDLIGRDDVDRAYAVQSLLHARSLADGRRVAGRKIGLTTPSVQAQFGLDQPDFGFLYADMEVDGDGVDTARLLQPRIEAEVAFVLGRDLDDDALDGPTGALGPAVLAEVAAAVDALVPALEIVDSRITGWDIALADTIADNASSGLFVLGAERVSPRVFGDDLAEGLATVSMTLTRGGTTVSSGTGADCLGSPLAALAWLAGTAVHHGEPLRAGQVVLSGALGPMVPVSPGDAFHAEILGLGSVSARFMSAG